MRKVTAIVFALFVTVSAIAAPSDSSDRQHHSAIAKIVRQIKNIVRGLVDGQPVPPTPNA